MAKQKKPNLGANVAYQLIYQVVTVFAPLIVTPYLSRVLGPEEIGKYSYTQSIAYYFVLAAGLGITAHGSRRISTIRDKREELEQVFSNLFWLHFFTAAMVLLAYIAAILLGVNRENRTLSLIMTFYVLSAMVDVKWFYYGLENFKITVLRSVLIKALNISLIFLFVKTKQDTPVYTFIMAFISFFLAEFSLFLLLPRHVKIRRPTMAGMKQEIAPLILLFLPSVANLLTLHSSKTMLGIMSTYVQVGFFENADKMFTILTTAITAFGDVLLPRISHLLANNAEEKAEKLFRNSLRICIIISCAFAFGLMSVSREFVPLFFGEDFNGCIPVLTWISPCLIFSPFSVIIRKQFLIPRYKEKVYIFSSVVGLVVLVMINLALIPSHGAMGAVYALLASDVSVVLSQYLWIRQELDYRPYFKDLVVFCVIGTIMYCGVRVTSSLSVEGWLLLLIEILVGIIIFTALSWGYMATAHDELMRLIKSMLHRQKRHKM